MLQGILLITVFGFFTGELAGRLGLPKLIGMLLLGILIGPAVMDIIPGGVLAISAEIRLAALLIILFKAGLGLDKEKIKAQGGVAIRLGFLPAVVEASTIAVITRLVLGWDWFFAWLLGWIICAASPAVIVPMMLRLKALGWGVKKGIPDLILAGGTASDAVAITMFGITLTWLSGEMRSGAWIQAAYIPVQIIGGIAVGFFCGKISHHLLSVSRITNSIAHDLIITLGLGIIIVLGGEVLPYSEFLAVMTMGFVILETNGTIARRLRKELDKIWVLGEIFLFVLIGAAVDISVIRTTGPYGLIIIGGGLMIGRWLGIFLSTWGSKLNIGERIFMVVGDMAKATVQAAIGGIPLAMGLPYGEMILAVAVLAILISAPLGAFGTAFLAPRLLEKGRVDPTKVTIVDDYCLLVAMDGSPVSWRALREAARMARQLDGRIIVLTAKDEKRQKDAGIDRLAQRVQEVARDIPFNLVIAAGEAETAILNVADREGVDMIFMGKHNRPPSQRAPHMGDITEAVVKLARIPVVLVENGVCEGEITPYH